MDGVKLGAVEVQKDVGVMVHQSLKPCVQVATAAKKPTKYWARF